MIMLVWWGLCCWDHMEIFWSILHHVVDVNEFCTFQCHYQLWSPPSNILFNTIMNLKEKCKKANSQKVNGSGNINNSDVKKTNNQNKRSSSKPSWLLKSQLWCYEKVLLVQLLTMLAMEPIIARLWRKLASVYKNVREFEIFFSFFF